MSDIRDRPVVHKLVHKAFNEGRESMKADILTMLNTCLDRDPTLQKLVKQIEDMS